MTISRRTLVIGSVGLHAAVLAGFWLQGAWTLERLDGGHRFIGSIAVMMPPPEASGGPTAAKNPMPEKKDPPKKVAKDPVQPTEQKTPPPKQPATEPDTGGGIGDGKGPGTGTGDPTATGTCTDPSGCGDPTPTVAAAVCGNGVRESGEQCDDGNRNAGDGCSATCAIEPAPQQAVPPQVLAGLRIAGDTQVHPSDVVKTQILHEGKEKIVGTLKLCVGTSGDVASVSVAGTTHFPDYDAALVSAARGWRYRPYTLAGKPVPVCGMVTFIYAIK